MWFDWLVSSGLAVLETADGVFRWLIGSSREGPGHLIARSLFLRVLGLIHLIAFVSFWVQIKGLIGRNGILPVARHLRAARHRFGRRAYHLFPTLFWLRSDDRALEITCAAGVVLSVLLVLSIAPAPILLLLWALYLSLVTAGRHFMAYQWDALLLEVSFLAVLLAPWGLSPGDAGMAVPGFALLLLWWTLFHLVFRSGVVKLRSGDPTWRNLTALDYHFYTQPLPTWPAWYMQRLPAALKQACVVATLALEILVPLLIFGPRSARLAACAGIVFLQLLIMATGNYNFFNLLTIALAMLLLDDVFWSTLLPDTVVAWLVAAGPEGSPPLMRSLIVLAVGVPFLVLSASRLVRTFLRSQRLSSRWSRVLDALEPFQTVNSYGLFSVMTTARPEIIVEASQDGETWHAYEFRYKPGDPARRPGFAQPHQPRLDWQMWVAALAGFELTPWFRRFLLRLLEGSPDVLKLIEYAPFDGRPRWVRATVYDYRFATAEERVSTGGWWVRQRLGPFTPTLTIVHQTEEAGRSSVAMLPTPPPERRTRG